MLEDPYDFRPQPHSRFWRRTLIAWLVIVSLGAGALAYCARAAAAPKFEAIGQDGHPAELELLETPCTNKKVVAQLRSKALDVRRFKAAVLTFGGKTWASCWIELQQLVFSIDEEGAPFQAVPRRLFKDSTI